MQKRYLEQDGQAGSLHFTDAAIAAGVRAYRQWDSLGAEAAAIWDDAAKRAYMADDGAMVREVVAAVLSAQGRLR
jgi:hypothetical protein